MSTAGKAHPKPKASIRRIFQRWLLVCVLVTFALTLCSTLYVQTQQINQSSTALLRVRIEDAKRQVTQNTATLTTLKAMTRASALAKARSMAEMLRLFPGMAVDGEALTREMPILDVDEIHVVDANGVITASTVSKVVGFHMDSTPQSKAFLPVIRGERSAFVQDPQTRGFSDKQVMQYAGVARQDIQGGMVQIGYFPRRLQRTEQMADLNNIARSLRIGYGGGILISDSKGVLVGGVVGAPIGEPIASYGLSAEDLTNPNPVRVTLGFAPSLCLSEPHESYIITAFLPINEMFAERGLILGVFSLTHLLLFLLVFILISVLVKWVVIDGINHINGSLHKITQGNLDESVQVQTNREFSSLSNGINSMVRSLKDAIAREAARLDAELAVAKAIQSSALPNPALLTSDRTDFTLAADMWTAKEVGGDFYDFFLMDETHLGFLVADVSGKGIPAALFMMTSKTLISDVSETRLDPAEILTEANRRICATNDTGLFVTVWLGVLDLTTGKLRYTSAGHNPPMLRRAETGAVDFLKCRPSLVLAGMPETRYRTTECDLAPGDMLFLYTDGVTEANNAACELYGDDRLRDLLNRPDVHTLAPAETLERVHAELAQFSGSAEQFDDITMLAVRYNGRAEMK